jgi:hypothetical protein
VVLEDEACEEGSRMSEIAREPDSAAYANPGNVGPAQAPGKNA